MAHAREGIPRVFVYIYIYSTASRARRIAVFGKPTKSSVVLVGVVLPSFHRKLYIKPRVAREGHDIYVAAANEPAGLSENKCQHTLGCALCSHVVATWKMV